MAANRTLGGGWCYDEEDCWGRSNGGLGSSLKWAKTSSMGGVMSDDFIDGYIALKMQEVTKFRAATHPLEYQMYYAN